MKKASKTFRLALAMLMALMAITADAAIENSTQITPPTFGYFTKRYETCWFSDPDNQLAFNLRKEIDDAISQVRDSTDMNLVAVYLDEYDGNLKDLAKDIHKQWHLASNFGLKDNGIVLLVVNKGKKAYIYTGIEATHKLPSENARLIVSRRIKPRMAKGNDVQAMIDGVNAIQELILHPENVEAMRAEPEANDDVELWWIATLCGAALLLAIIVKIREKKKQKA